MALRTYSTFAEAQADAEAKHMKVGGAIRQDGTPVYFTHSSGLSDHDAREMGFEARYGKPMDPYQRSILELAEAADA